MQGKIKSFIKQISKKNSEYLRIELEDGFVVSFFNTSDSSKEVKEGDIISFEFKSKENFNNGTKLEILPSNIPLKTIQVPKIENKMENNLESLILKALNTNNAYLEKITLILERVFK